MKTSKLFKSIASATLVMAMVAPMTVVPGTTASAAKFSAKSAKLTVGQNKKITVKGAKKGSKFTWKSSNSKVAKVTAKKNKATIKGVAAGTAKITCVVKKGKKKSTVSGLTVKVRQKITSLAIQDSASKAATKLTIKPGEKIVVKGAINNNASGSTTNQTVKWTSSNTKVAKVAKKNVNQATVTGLTNGTAVITVKADGKTATCTIEVKGSGSQQPSKETDKPKATTPAKKATPTPKPTYRPGFVYEQRSKEVTRWYKNATAAQSENGHAHDGYSVNSFAIWMVGFFDNEFSTNEDKYNEGIYGPALDDYKGKELSIEGQFKYDGKTKKTVLFQINYTSPADYPILWKWEKGANNTNGKDSDGTLNKVKNNGKTKSEEAAAGEWHDLDISFTIPKDAKNGDTDDSGKSYGIYLYFPNQPDGALLYTSDNTFHFKNFAIKK